MPALRDTTRNAGIALLVASVAIAFAIGVLFQTVARSSDDAVSAKNLAERIQRERIRSIRENCEGSNARNRETKRRLDRLIVRLPPERRARAKASAAGTRLLIDALAPVRDCDRLVARQAPGSS